LYLPLRSLFENMDAEVYYNSYTKGVQVKYGSRNITFYQGRSYMLVNGRSVKISAPVINKENRTYVPKEAMTALGYQMDYISSVKLVRLYSVSVSPSKLSGLVLHVVDGNTFRVLINHQTYTVRLAGVTVAPMDPSKSYSSNGLTYMNAILPGQEVDIYFDTMDELDNGYLLGYVYCGKTFINREVLRMGYGKLLQGLSQFKYMSTLISAHNTAYSKKLGIWDDPDYIYNALNNETYGAACNLQNLTYHSPSCNTVRYTEPKYIFYTTSYRVAKNAGFEACGSCRPR